MDHPTTKSKKILQPGTKYRFPTSRQLTHITLPFSSIPSGSWRNFEIFFSTCSSIITTTSDKNSTKEVEISYSRCSLQAISRTIAPGCQNPSNSSAIFTKKSPWISILTRSHYEGRRKTGSFTHPNDSLRCQIGGSSSARFRKKK